MTTKDLQTIGVNEGTISSYLDYLNRLRRSGTVNMFGARPYLMNAFPELTRDQAAKVLAYWMETFSE